ncbi:phage head closure protein [Bacillus sp. 1P02SD]|uniref:phage head closure protein n=1 Tax=Bacillus sp. 1P02SD TaxID=3132264 RepID=UPI00399F01C9
MKSLASRLNKRITVLRAPDPEIDVDEAGQPLDDFIPVAKVWASIEPLRGRELFAAQQENVEVTTRIRIRYRKGIDRTMIARFEDSEFEFLYVIHVNFEKKELQIMAKERQ